jgi:hypothetical protein
MKHAKSILNQPNNIDKVVLLPFSIARSIDQFPGQALCLSSLDLLASRQQL